MKKVISLFTLFIFLLSSLKIFSLGQVELQSTENKVVDNNLKQKEAVSMVNRAVDFIKANTIEAAASSFEKDDQWFFGDMSILLLDSNGIILVDGSNVSNVWKNLAKSNVESDRDAWKVLSKVSSNGQWISYKWKNSYKSSYAKKIVKGGQEYIIATGFYPEVNKFAIQQLVNRAVRHFNTEGPSRTWDLINNPLGDFIQGDVHVFAFDIDGMKLADNRDAALIGQNMLNFQDTKGRFYVKDIINIANSSKGQGWIKYDYRFVDTLSFVKKVTDKETGKSYVIGAGYYPDLTANTVKNLVNKAASYLHTAGSLRAFSSFASTDINSPYNHGPLEIFVYDLQGNVLVDAETPRLVGQNIINLKDPEGTFITKDIINIATKSGNGWVSFYSKNGYKSVYVSLVNTAEGKFIIGSGFFPDSKQQQVIALVERASDFLINNNKYQAFSEFTNPYGRFFKGDLSIFVYTPKGTALANGDNKMVVWDNFIQNPADRDKVIIDEVIDLAKSGGGWLDYKIRNATRKVYTKLITKVSTLPGGNKLTERFIIGSGYFI